jgi:regulator-associated protein of mTOR
VSSEAAGLKLTETGFHSLTSEVADLLVCHAYEPLLVCANAASGQICTWQTDPIDEVAKFSNGIRPGQRVTSIKILNEQTESLLAVGSSDGVVRLWKSFWAEPELLTSWRAISHLSRTETRDVSLSAGLVMDWMPSQGRLLASGDVPYVQVWDAATETRVSRIPSGVQYCVTSICVDKNIGNLAIAGYGNGSVRLFDIRVPVESSLVQHYEQHQHWVCNVHMQRGGRNHVISASRGGDVLWWDPRYPSQPVRTLLAYKLTNDAMNTMVVHDYASLLATATQQQYIKIFNLEGDMLTHHKHYTNYLGDAIGPIRSLAFHPIRPFLAAGSADKLVSIYTPGR